MFSPLLVCCRTNSDSALHQSAVNPAPQDTFVGGSQELQLKGVKTCTNLGVFSIFVSYCYTA